MAFYRNQTPTMDQIKMMGNMRITTPAEATAFLRTLPKILEQVSYVTQRIGLGEQHQANREAMEKIERAVEETPAPIAPEPKEFVPADLGTDESFSEKEVEEKVAKLKSAKKKEIEDK